MRCTGKPLARKKSNPLLEHAEAPLMTQCMSGALLCWEAPLPDVCLWLLRQNRREMHIVEQIFHA